MIDEKALFKLSYGLYIAGVEWGGKKNACIINTAAQATAEPNQMLVTMLKSNYTTELLSLIHIFPASPASWERSWISRCVCFAMAIPP